MAPVTLAAFAPTNFFPPYDPALFLPQADRCSVPFRVGVNAEYGWARNGRNANSDRANVLQIYDATQALIPMLINAQNPAATNLFLCAGQPMDDGVRGHVEFNGRFSQIDVTPFVRYMLPIDMPGDLSVSAALPFRHAKLDRVTFANKTLAITPADLAINTFFDDLNTNVKALGGPDLGNWSNSGLGDLVVMFDWYSDYEQDRDGLENVSLHAKLGVTCPTGLKKDEDRAFSFALGNDGAWGLPFGLGIDIDFKSTIRLGGEAEFLVLFDNSKTRRIKTEIHQTEFLLLNKARATKDYGLSWKFYLYLQSFHFWKGLSLKTAYEYIKHDSDRLTLKSDANSTLIANTAVSLGEWNSHNIIFSMNYDGFGCNWPVQPQLSIFYKLPVGGKAVINCQTVGGQCAINF